MIYTTYITKYLKLKKENNLPNNTKFLLVMRYKPKWLDLEENDIFYTPSLSPLPNILLDYKNDKDFDRYMKRFNNQMIDYEKTRVSIDKISTIIKDKNVNICLICCEKDYLFCHRYLLAKKIMDNSDIEWKEL